MLKCRPKREECMCSQQREGIGVYPKGSEHASYMLQQYLVKIVIRPDLSSVDVAIVIPVKRVVTLVQPTPPKL